MTEHITSASESNHFRTSQVPESYRRNENQSYRPSYLEPRYDTAGARSTRMVIDSASYETTPTESPPNEYRCVFNARDCHRNVPTIEALAAVERSLSANTTHGQSKHGHAKLQDTTTEDRDKDISSLGTGQSSTVRDLQNQPITIKLEEPTEPIESSGCIPEELEDISDEEDDTDEENVMTVEGLADLESRTSKRDRLRKKKKKKLFNDNAMLKDNTALENNKVAGCDA